MNLRRLARNEQCYIRLPMICNRNSETVVLAHWRQIGVSGLGIKSPDILGCPACSDCHAYVDSHHDAETQVSFARGVFRWQNELVKRGVVKWK